MKKIIFLCSIAAAVNTAAAQPRGGGDRSNISPQERQQRAAERRVARNADLRATLVLNDSLARIIDEVNARYDAQMDELFAANTADRQAVRSRMENIQSARTAEIKTHLSEEQQKKYDSYVNERNGGMRSGPRNGGRTWVRNPNP